MIFIFLTRLILSVQSLKQPLIVGHLDGSITCVDITNGDTIWTLSTGRPLVDYYGTKEIIPTIDGHFLFIEHDGLVKLLPYTIRDFLLSSNFRQNDIVYTTTEHTEKFRIHLETGHLASSERETDDSDDDWITVRRTDYQIVAKSSSTSKIHWTISVGEYLFSTPDNPTIVVPILSEQENLYAVQTHFPPESASPLVGISCDGTLRCYSPVRTNASRTLYKQSWGKQMPSYAIPVQAISTASNFNSNVSTSGYFGNSQHTVWTTKSTSIVESSFVLLTENEMVTAIPVPDYFEYNTLHSLCYPTTPTFESSTCVYTCHPILTYQPSFTSDIFFQNDNESPLLTYRRIPKSLNSGIHNVILSRTPRNTTITDVYPQSSSFSIPLRSFLHIRVFHHPMTERDPLVRLGFPFIYYPPHSSSSELPFPNIQFPVAPIHHPPSSLLVPSSQQYPPSEVVTEEIIDWTRWNPNYYHPPPLLPGETPPIAPSVKFSLHFILVVLIVLVIVLPALIWYLIKTIRNLLKQQQLADLKYQQDRLLDEKRREEELKRREEKEAIERMEKEQREKEKKEQEQREEYIKKGWRHIAGGRLRFNPNSIIGEGQRGTSVFDGVTTDGRKVAVKRILRTHTTSQRTSSKLDKGLPDMVIPTEIKVLLASDNQCDNVVKYYAMENDADFVYITLEKCSSNLSTYFSHFFPPPPPPQQYLSRGTSHRTLFCFSHLLRKLRNGERISPHIPLFFTSSEQHIIAELSRLGRIIKNEPIPSANEAAIMKIVEDEAKLQEQKRNRERQRAKRKKNAGTTPNPQDSDDQDEPVRNRLETPPGISPQQPQPNPVPSHSVRKPSTHPLLVNDSILSASVRELLLGIACGIDHLHTLNIIHRDIKPSNILIDAVGRPKVADMGLSTFLDESEPRGGATLGPNWHAGSVGWEAPEIVVMKRRKQARLTRAMMGQTRTDRPSEQTAIEGGFTKAELKVDKANDVFSLGCVFYATVMGGQDLNDSYAVTLIDVDLATNGCDDSSISWTFKSEQIHFTPHPFGSIVQRENNIVDDIHPPDLLYPLCIADPTMRDLITKMLSHHPSQRPTIDQVVHHPALWKDDKRLEFISAVSDFLDHISPTDPINVAIEEQFPHFMGASPFEPLRKQIYDTILHQPYSSDWMNIISPILQPEINAHRNYEGTSLRHLLRVLRNKSTHYNEVNELVKNALFPDGIPTGMITYFLHLFPTLLIDVYRTLLRFPEVLKHENLGRFFK
ncbi:putative Sensor for unfolded proteins in the ER ire1 [Blattamonas nauphoetae]|uniref:non-specific serine/threonine protein kinase n=1 Tax=Blattamonas nauphoetae TaxID=2049346 RepID=A0ABQ9YHA0_9EUKA|nr:putative Sensor for unfolded proteins in the ER ire1 [Blattamonas nauphoetae]